MDWENYLEKNPIQQIKKTVKIRVKLPHVNKKPLPRNRIFVQTPFLHSTLKLERKNFTPHNHSLFAPFPVSAWPKSLLNLTSKIMKMCEQIKKRQRPNTIQILWIVKNTWNQIQWGNIFIKQYFCIYQETFFVLSSTKPSNFRIVDLILF